MGVLRAVAGIFKQARAQRVTDRGKEKHGTLPSVAYAPRAVAAPSAREPARPTLSGRAISAAASSSGGANSSSADASSTPETHEVLHRAGDLVVVRAVSGGMWVAQLSEPIIKITGSDGVRFNVDRAKARYFVLTAELGSYPHALQFWSLGQGGMQRRLGGAAAAASRAAESDGEHFSYEKDDRVTRTAVRSRFVGVSEEAHHRGKLVSFALTAEALLEARQATIGGADTAIESDEDTEVAERLAEREANAAAAAAAAAQASEERHLSLNARRDMGKAKQAADAKGKAAAKKRKGV